MLKKTAIELLGGTPVKAAKAMRYKSPHAIYVWPEVLSQGLVDKVNGALMRLNAQATRPGAQANQPQSDQHA